MLVFVLYSLVLWHIHPRKLFNAKSTLYIYIYIHIYMISFGCVLWHINHCRLFNVNSSSYLYIKYKWFVWFVLVLWHINHCRLFNTKSSLYIYIKYIWFGLGVFYGISTIVGYLIPNPLYTHILNISDLVWVSFMAYQPL